MASAAWASIPLALALGITSIGCTVGRNYKRLRSPCRTLFPQRENPAHWKNGGCSSTIRSSTD